MIGFWLAGFCILTLVVVVAITPHDHQ